MPIAIAIIAILIVGAIAGSALNFAGVFLGIPFVLILIGALIGLETMQRQSRIRRMRRFRHDARAHKADLTPADKRTIV